MKFGCCIGVPAPEGFKEWKEQISRLTDIGYDYVELPLARTMALSSDMVESVKKMLDEQNLPCSHFNIFLPGQFHVTGPSTDEAAIKDYLEKSIQRAAKMGGRYIVFGSGGARRVPEGFSYDDAIEQLVNFLNMANDIAAQHDVVIVIEPLNRGETNIINSVEEGSHLALKVNKPNIKLLADSYHMNKENEPLDILTKADKILAHIHVSANDRTYPRGGDFDFVTFFGLLKNIDYSGSISVECRWNDFYSEAASSLDFLKKAWDMA